MSSSYHVQSLLYHLQFSILRYILTAKPWSPYCTLKPVFLGGVKKKSPSCERTFCIQFLWIGTTSCHYETIIFGHWHQMPKQTFYKVVQCIYATTKIFGLWFITSKDKSQHKKQENQLDRYIFSFEQSSIFYQLDFERYSFESTKRN